MFTQLMSLLNDKDTITVAITRTGDVMSVSVVPGKRIKGLAPIIITGSAEEINANFVEVMTKPLEKISAKLVVNDTQFETSLEEASDEKDKSASTKKTATKKVVKESNEDKLKDINKLIKDKKYEEAKNKLIKLEFMSSGTLKKEAAAKLYEVRTEIMKAATIDFEKEAVDESSEIVIPQKIKEIADASPNVILAKMPPNPNPHTEISVEDEQEPSDFEDEEELEDEFEDDDF